MATSIAEASNAGPVDLGELEAHGLANHGGQSAMRWIAITGVLLTAPVFAGVERSVTDCFDYELTTTSTRITDTEIGRASWSTVCGDDCASGCCEEACCGDACGDSTCCGSSVGCCGLGDGGCCPPCRKNCGLLGKGYLTHDPCGEPNVIPELLLGKLFCESEDCFDDFISPMTNPIYFEDPRNLTELHAFFWHHSVPTAAGGGKIQLYAVQIRAALTDRLSLIATKDGYAVSSNPLIDDGWADVDIGFKYGFYRNARKQRLASAGFTYNMPVGSTRTLQGKGGGNFHLFLTGGAELFDCGHWISAFGGNIPADAGENSHFLYWSNHFDYQIRRGWYGLLEFNWFHWTDGGDNTLGLTGVEGLDVFNFGSAGVAGNDIVTGAFGLKYKPSPKYEIGVAWEVPLTERRDVIDNRLTVDLNLRY